MNLGPHADFIVAAYGIAVLVVAARPTIRHRRPAAG